MTGTGVATAHECLLNVVCIPPNTPPSTASTPSGPSSGWLGQSLSYSTSSSDANGDAMTFTFNWGDGTQTSGGSIQSHAWSLAGNHCVTAFATDQHGFVGPASGCRNVAIQGDCGTGGDAGDTRDTATPMSNPGSCAGFLTPSDPSDFYQFTIATNGRQINVDVDTRPACEGERYLMQWWDNFGREGGAAGGPPTSGSGCFGPSMAIGNSQAGLWHVEVRYNANGPGAPTQNYVLNVWHPS